MNMHNTGFAALLLGLSITVTASQARAASRDVAESGDLGVKFEQTEMGLEISLLQPDSVAAKAKFQSGDVVIAVDERRVRTESDFDNLISAAKSDVVPIMVLREEQKLTLHLNRDAEDAPSVTKGAWFGVDLNDRFATAAVVRRVHPNSPAQRAGIRDQDVILSVDGQRITTARHLGRVISRMEPGREVEIRIDRRQQSQSLHATLARRESVAARQAPPLR